MDGVQQRPLGFGRDVLVGVGSWFLSEKVVDIDSNQEIHFVWVPGGYSGEVKYVKYDNQGNVLISEMTAVQNVQSTHVPNMAVSSDDAVNIIYEDYRYQCEDINYNKLVDGKIVKDAIAISSDVASHCEFCNCNSIHTGAISNINTLLVCCLYVYVVNT